MKDAVGQPASAPGAWCPPGDRWDRFEQLCESLPEGALVVADRRVLALHPQVARALRKRKPLDVLALPAGERTKSTAMLTRVLAAGAGLPRTGTMLVVGGGTVGDLGTVAAHLLKRGVRLIQAPTTLLAAVDSSLGGKGAVNVGVGRAAVKNAAGVFHYPAESWLCPELWTTLSAAQRREGLAEAWKMAVTLEAPVWERWRAGGQSELDLVELVRTARELKARVCEADPYERVGLRQVLNFGHTVGHVLESLSGYSVRHGEAVGLGMLCALDVGRVRGVTPAGLAESLEASFAVAITGKGARGRIARTLSRGSVAEALALLGADKKVERAGSVKMILLEDVGRTRGEAVALKEALGPLIRCWRAGKRP